MVKGAFGACVILLSFYPFYPLDMCDVIQGSNGVEEWHCGRYWWLVEYDHGSFNGRHLFYAESCTAMAGVFLVSLLFFQVGLVFIAISSFRYVPATLGWLIGLDADILWVKYDWLNDVEVQCFRAILLYLFLSPLWLSPVTKNVSSSIKVILTDPIVKLAPSLAKFLSARWVWLGLSFFIPVLTFCYVLALLSYHLVSNLF